MPTPTIPCSMIRLHVFANGAPWNYQRWQDITNIHDGLFPEDDDKLPPDWTRRMAEDVKSYFDQYKGIDSEDGSQKFAQAPPGTGLEVLGRNIWKEFIGKLWKKCHIHDRIIAVMRSENLHPISIAQVSDDPNKWPSGDEWIPTILEPVAIELFGRESLTVNDRYLDPNVRRILRPLVQRTWSRLSRQHGECKKKIEALRVAAQAAFDNLSDGPLTKKKVQAVINTVGKWKRYAETIAAHKESFDKIKEMDDELQRILTTLSGEMEPIGIGKAVGISRVTKEMLEALATSEDVSDLARMYKEYFITVGDPGPIIEPQPLGIAFGEAVGGCNPGMEVEHRMPPDTLNLKLGFEEGMPPTFHRIKHRVLAPWALENQEVFLNPDLNDPDIQPLQLSWHQLAGIHSFIRCVFSSSESSRPQAPGMLIADDVGLGKTFTTIGIIGFLNLTLKALENKSPLPPIICERPYMCGTGGPESLPHLVIVAGTLMQQWKGEFKTLFRRKTVDILLYGAGKQQRTQFWSEGGPFNTSMHEPCHKIVIASQTALQQDFNQCFESNSREKTLPWDKSKAKEGVNLKGTLYGQRWLTVTIDEAHTYRNLGPRHSAVLRLLNHALLRIILTATPLHTSTKDVAAMGRLVGIPHFLSNLAFEQEKEDAAVFRRVKKDQAKDFDPLDANNALHKEYTRVARRLQLQFQGHILVRTIDTLDWQGRKILQLPGYDTAYLCLDLTPRELKIINQLGAKSKDMVSAANGMGRFVSKSFYVEYRLAVGWAGENEDDTPPTAFESMQSWLDVKSTKMDACARLTQHLLAHDHAPQAFSKDGQLILPPIPPTPPGSMPPQTKRVLIYQEFTSLGLLLRSVMNLYGIETLNIDGDMSFEQRAAIIKNFGTPGSPRVLIISSVGGTGLNLSMACYLIFFDQVWSAQDARQIIGRIYRQPQALRVVVYHMIANSTADMLVSGMARGKHDMLEAFLKKEEGMELEQLLSGRHLVRECTESEEDSEEVGASGGKGKMKRKPRKKKVTEKNKKVNVEMMENSRKLSPPGPSNKAPKELNPEHVPGHNIQHSSSSLPSTSSPTQNARDAETDPPPTARPKSSQVPLDSKVSPPPSSNTKVLPSLSSKNPQPHPSSVQSAPPPPPLSQSPPEIRRKTLTRRVKPGMPLPLPFTFDSEDYQTPHIAQSHPIQDHLSPRLQDNFDQAPNLQQLPTTQLTDSLTEHRMNTSPGPDAFSPGDVRAGFNPAPSTPKRAQGNKRSRSATTSPDHKEATPTNPPKKLKRNAKYNHKSISVTDSDDSDDSDDTVLDHSYDNNAEASSQLANLEGQGFDGHPSAPSTKGCISNNIINDATEYWKSRRPILALPPAREYLDRGGAMKNGKRA